VRARDTIAVVVAGDGHFDLAGPYAVADDEEPGGGIEFTRRAAFPAVRVHRPLRATQTVALAAGTECVVPRGTWIRVRSGGATLAWITFELHQPSWLGLLESSLVAAAASSTALSRVAFEAFRGALGAPQLDDAAAIAEWQRALDRLAHHPAETWALWCDAADYLPGQLVCPQYLVAADPAALDGEHASAVRRMAARSGPFALSGFAKQFDPPLVPGAAFAALEALVDAGVLRRDTLTEGDQ
jgi:hypothetical protein